MLEHTAGNQSGPRLSFFWLIEIGARIMGCSRHHHLPQSIEMSAFERLASWARGHGYRVDLYAHDLPVAGRIDYESRAIQINEHCAYCALTTMAHELGHLAHYLDTGLEGDEDAAWRRGYEFVDRLIDEWEWDLARREAGW